MKPATLLQEYQNQPAQAHRRAWYHSLSKRGTISCIMRKSAVETRKNSTTFVSAQTVILSIILVLLNRHEDTPRLARTTGDHGEPAADQRGWS